jgi:seryl-tRNA synthetase
LLIERRQFTKVELFAVSTPETSEAMHAEILDLQQALYAELGIPFRCVLLRFLFLCSRVLLSFNPLSTLYLSLSLSLSRSF